MEVVFRRRGNALILSVFLLLALTSVGIVSIQRARTDLIVAGNLAQADSANAAGQSAIVYGLYTVMDQLTAIKSQVTNTSGASQPVWLGGNQPQLPRARNWRRPWGCRNICRSLCRAMPPTCRWPPCSRRAPLMSWLCRSDAAFNSPETDWINSVRRYGMSTPGAGFQPVQMSHWPPPSDHQLIFMRIPQTQTP